jgi:hypothetical protein
MWVVSGVLRPTTCRTPAIARTWPICATEGATGPLRSSSCVGGRMTNSREQHRKGLYSSPM